MGAFSGMGSVARGYSSNFLRPGRYVVRIDSCETFEAGQAETRMWKNTLTILAVEDGGEKPHKVGEQVHVMYTRLQKYPKMFLQNVKGFLASVLDVSDDEIGEDEALTAASEDSPMKGLVTLVSGQSRNSKTSRDNDGNPTKYTVHSWSPSFDDDEIEAAIGEEGMAKFFPNGFDE